MIKLLLSAFQFIGLPVMAQAFAVSLSITNATAYLAVTGGSPSSTYAIESNRWGGWEQIIVTQPGRLWLWPANQKSELFRARLLPAEFPERDSGILRIGNGYSKSFGC